MGDRRRPNLKPTGPGNDTRRVSFTVGQTPGRTPDLIFTVSRSLRMEDDLSFGEETLRGCHDPGNTLTS
jgi:hypothetical protein